MVIEMELQVKFNRSVDLNRDYIVPGGYEFEIDKARYI